MSGRATSLHALNLGVQTRLLTLEGLLLLEVLQGVGVRLDGSRAARPGAIASRAGVVRHPWQHAHEHRRHLVVERHAGQRFMTTRERLVLRELAQSELVAGGRRQTRAGVVLRLDDVADPPDRCADPARNDATVRACSCSSSHQSTSGVLILPFPLSARRHWVMAWLVPFA